MPQRGKALPLARSRKSCRTGGTHWGIARQLGAAKHSSTTQPSTARALCGEINDRLAKKAAKLAAGFDATAVRPFPLVIASIPYSLIVTATMGLKPTPRGSRPSGLQSVTNVVSTGLSKGSYMRLERGERHTVELRRTFAPLLLMPIRADVHVVVFGAEVFGSPNVHADPAVGNGSDSYDWFPVDSLFRHLQPVEATRESH